MNAMRLTSPLQPFVRVLVAFRTMLSLGFSVAAGVIVAVFYPADPENPLLRLVSRERPGIYLFLSWSYNLFLYSTPFLFFSMLFSLIYVHSYRGQLERAAGALPPYPDPRTREQVTLVLGEIHHPLIPKPVPSPRWLSIPEPGLYTGIAVFGSIGSGKTAALILPAMRQLFSYRAHDPEQKLSGIVLEVKGDLCRQLRRILAECGRGNDYIEVALDGDIRYNPLNNSLDAYAQAFSIASIITSIWGKGKEPFWQQSYTDLLRYVILLHRLRDGYLTMVDLFHTILSARRLEALMIEVGTRLNEVQYLGIGEDGYRPYEALLSPFGFAWRADAGQHLVPWTEQLERLLVEQTDIEFRVYARKACDPDQRDLLESVQYWYWEHWKFFRSEVKTSIVQGIVVFLSLFETDSQVRRVFCPPKELYEGKACSSDPKGRVLAPFAELIESGAVIGLNFPVALNPALAKTIGTMMKIDYQRAVQLRIPRMDAEPHHHFRPTVFLCDEYQNFATVGGDNPTGDERFLSMSRQPKCIPIIATQSISSLMDALPSEGGKTLLQALRNKIFLTTTDPATARYASELCGKANRTRISYSVSESSSNANVGWLSGRTSSSKGSVSASKQYQRQKEPLFEEKLFFELKNAQSVVLAFDGVSPLPPTYCYLKPDFLPVTLTWFEQERIAFDPKGIAP
jgi:hypothetical protein